MKKNKNSIAKAIGVIFANVQSLFDDLFSFTFKKMKEFGEKEQKKIDSKCLKTKALVFSKKISTFVGEMGKSFYETYEDIKRKNKEKKD